MQVVPSYDAPSVRLDWVRTVKYKLFESTTCHSRNRQLALSVVGGNLINQSREYTLPALGSEIEGISLQIKEHLH